MFKLEKLALAPNLWQWDPLPDTSQARHVFIPCVYSGQVYLCGKSSQLIERFNPQTNMFTSCINFDEAFNCVLFEDAGDLVITSDNKYGRYRVENGNLKLQAICTTHEQITVWGSMAVVRGENVFISQNGACIAINKDSGSKGLNPRI